jgi:glycerate-2-kinase
MSNKTLLRKTFDAVLQEVRPQNLIRQQCRLKGDVLTVAGQSYDLNKYKNIYLLGSGKAVVPMAQEIHALLSSYITKSLIIGAYECSEKFGNCLYFKSTHPLPSQKSIQAARALQTMMASLDEEDLFIYLLSGGNSAMVELPEEPITLNEFQEATSLMLKGAMPIEKINSVRKHISQVKGGKLANCTQAQGIVLVLSDVIGDDLHAIGSAPLYCDTTTFEDAKASLEEYGLFETMPQSIQNVIEEGQKGLRTETPKIPHKHIDHYILGSNTLVLQKAQRFLSASGVDATVIEKPIEGDTQTLAEELLAFATSHQQGRHCYIFGGEATVLVQGEGKGGRNQHLCLSVLKQLAGKTDITFLSAATDGIDGNSDAAGAVIDIHSYVDARSHNIDVQHYLETFDSNSFFAQTGELLVPGPTHNNLLDIVMMLIEPKPREGETNG